MKQVTICTGFHPAGYVEYGQKFLESFDRYWPGDVNLLCFTEQHVPIPRGNERNVWSIPGAQSFMSRYADRPLYCGRQAIPGKWASKHIVKGYYYKFDAVKFFKQIIIPNAAASELPDGAVLAWFDGDVITHRMVPDDWVPKLLGDHDVCFLGRRDMHTELGFWAVRLGVRTRMFLERLSGMYLNGSFEKLPEWHSAYVFDYVRTHCPDLKLVQNNLTPSGFGHVWFQSPLGQYTDHLKGERRKASGRSEERK